MVLQSFPGGSEIKNLPANAGEAGDAVSIPSLRSPGGGHGNPLQYPCLKNPMDKEAWQATTHGITRTGHNLATKSTNQPHVITVGKKITLLQKTGNASSLTPCVL